MNTTPDNKQITRLPIPLNAQFTVVVSFPASGGGKCTYRGLDRNTGNTLKIARIAAFLGVDEKVLWTALKTVVRGYRAHRALGVARDAAWKATRALPEGTSTLAWTAIFE